MIGASADISELVSISERERDTFSRPLAWEAAL